MSKEHAQVHHKHVPQRICAVCREKVEKQVLTRLVCTDAGLFIDPSGKMNGRGAYLCNNRSCWERAVKTTILDKALKATLTDEDRKRLQQAMPPS